MTKLLELLALLAPFLALAVLLRYRRRAPWPAAWGILGAASAAIGAIWELVASRTMWFDVRSADDVLDHLESDGQVRVVLVGAGLLLMLVGALLGRGRIVPRIPLAAAGVLAAALGAAARFVRFDVDPAREFLGILIDLAIDTVQFGMLGLGVLLLAVAVVSGRDERPEPLGDVVRLAEAGLRAVRNRRSEASRETPPDEHR